MREQEYRSPEMAETITMHGENGNELWTIVITQVDHHLREGKFKFFETQKEAFDFLGVKVK